MQFPVEPQKMFYNFFTSAVVLIKTCSLLHTYTSTTQNTVQCCMIMMLLHLHTCLTLEKRCRMSFFTYLPTFITHIHTCIETNVNLTPRQHFFPQNMHQRREQNKQIDIYVSASGQKATNSISHPM